MKKTFTDFPVIFKIEPNCILLPLIVLMMTLQLD